MLRILTSIGLHDRADALKAECLTGVMSDPAEFVACVETCALGDRAGVVLEMCSGRTGRTRPTYLFTASHLLRLVSTCRLTDRAGVLRALMGRYATTIANKPECLTALVAECGLSDRGNVCRAALRIEILRPHVTPTCIDQCALRDRRDLMIHLVPASTKSLSPKARLIEQNTQTGSERKSRASTNDDENHEMLRRALADSLHEMHRRVIAEMASNASSPPPPVPSSVVMPSPPSISSSSVSLSSPSPSPSLEAKSHTPEQTLRPPLINRMGLVESARTDIEPCFICLERERNVVAFPCGHRTHCLACDKTNPIKACLKCHEPVELLHVVQ